MKFKLEYSTSLIICDFNWLLFKSLFPLELNFKEPLLKFGSKFY